MLALPQRPYFASFISLNLPILPFPLHSSEFRTTWTGKPCSSENYLYHKAVFSCLHFHKQFRLHYIYTRNKLAASQQWSKEEVERTRRQLKRSLGPTRSPARRTKKEHRVGSLSLDSRSVCSPRFPSHMVSGCSPTCWREHRQCQAAPTLFLTRPPRGPRTVIRTLLFIRDKTENTFVISLGTVF